MYCSPEQVFKSLFRWNPEGAKEDNTPMERIQPSEVLVKEFTQDRRTKKLSLSEVVLRSAQMMLQHAIEEEVQEFFGTRILQTL